MFIYVLRPGWGDKFYGQKKWHYVPVISEVVIQVTSKSWFIDVKKKKKSYNSIIETVPWIGPFIDVKTMNIHLYDSEKYIQRRIEGPAKHLI